MAAPKDMTTANFTGTFYMNKTLSDSTDEILSLQGVGWMKRKAVAIATITLYVKHYKDDKNIEHIDINQTLTGGIPGTTEIRVVDWTDRSHTDHMFGNVVGKSRRVKLEEIEDDFQKKDWDPELVKEGLIESYVVSTDNDWIADQIWGFQVVEGEKRWVRHVVLTCPQREKRVEAKLIYDYYGELEEFDPELAIA